VNESGLFKSTMELFDLFSREFHDAVDNRVKRIIFTFADVLSGVKLGSSLANNDAARLGVLSLIEFYSKAF